MKPRKIILLSSCALLLIICILQGISKTKDTVKTFEFSETPDAISIQKTDGEIKLVLENEEWFVGEKKYPTLQSTVDSIIDDIKSVRALDKVGKANNQNMLDRYELNDGQKIVVTASLNGKVLRTIHIGKTSSTGGQTYVMFDDNQDVYLSAGNLKNTFAETIETIRSKIVYSVPKESVSKVTLKYPNQPVWTVSRSGQGTEISWAISGYDVELDSAKALDWFNSVATLATPVWCYDDVKDIPGDKELDFVLESEGKTITLEITKVPAMIEGGADIYYGKCSETPYLFEIASYTVPKFLKKVEDISK